MAKKDKKDKKAEKPGAGAPVEDGAIRVIAHPRARASIRRWRGRAGLLALILVTLLSLRAGLPAFDAVLRGLAAGIAAQFVAWAAGVVAWRHLIIGELAVHREAREAAAAARSAAAQRRAAEAIAAQG
jgi:hypothetical protein